MKYFYLCLLGVLFCININKSFAQNFNEVIKVVASDRGVNDYYGYSVAISNDYAISGAKFDSEDTLGLNPIFKAGSAYFLERDTNGIWQQKSKVVASDRSNSSNGGQFGFNVAISGNYAIIGEPYDDSDSIGGTNNIGDAGSAFIFERNTNGNWVEVKKLVASDRANLDNFGKSVSISGNYAVVGAESDTDSLGNNPLGSAGAAYIFERDANGNWSEIKKIVSSDRMSGDDFGSSVSISGNYIIVGAPWQDYDSNGNNFINLSGSAYIFERNGSGNWYQVQKIVPANRLSGEFFGEFVSISGDYIIIGVPNNSTDSLGNNPLSFSGAAYIFEKDSFGNWNEIQKIVANDRGSSDVFGESVSISGNRCVVGAFQEDEDAFSNNTSERTGSAYVFERNGVGNWYQSDKIVASDRDSNDYFGFSVGISGDYIISGAYSEDEDTQNNNYFNNAGSVYLYNYCVQAFSIDTISNCGNYTWIDGVTYYSSNSTAMFHYYGGAYNGCDSVVLLNLTIYQNSTADFNFVDNGNANYSFTNTSVGIFNETRWAFGDGTTATTANINHTYNANGTYVVVLTLNDSAFSGSCMSYAIDTIIVTGVSNPVQCQAGFVMYPDTSAGNVIVVNSAIGTNLTYLWDFGDGSPNSTLSTPTHTYASSGPFYLCLTVDDGAGCIDMYCDSIGVNGVVFKQTGFTINVVGAPTPVTTDIDKIIDTNSDLLIYPNPTLDLLFVKTELELIRINIIDITGNVLKSSSTSLNTIDVTSLASGVYFIRLFSEEKTITRKLVKQ